MKFFLALTMAFLTMSALANDKKETKSLEQKKAKLISGIDERISQLQKNKSCIQQAQDEKTLSECRRSKPNRRDKLRKKLKEAAMPREQKVEKNKR